MSQNITLTEGMRANLFSLQNTSKLMELTQKRLATGKRVNTALDDPINFFAAQNHQQRADDLAFRKDAMGEAIQTIKAADNGINAITTLIASAKSTAQSALSTSSTAERSDLAVQYNAILDQIDTLAADSGYKGVNFLAAESMTVTFDASGDSTLSVTGFNANAGGLSISDATSNWGSAANINASVTQLDAATTSMRTEAQDLSNSLSTITARQDFTDKMINTLEDGVANLTNADLNEEGANMLMLQTQQALGTTALSLASQAAQGVLRLF
jgi:flagellin-like hook-associated protein FlgL